jgi:hypothetical protein
MDCPGSCLEAEGWQGCCRCWQNHSLHHTSSGEFLKNKRWLLHELKHIEQFRRHGFVSFIVLYLWESIRRGYSQNKYEVEARTSENEEGLLERMELKDKSY